MWILLFFYYFQSVQLSNLSPRVVFPKQAGPIQGILGPGNIRPQYHGMGSTFNYMAYGGRPIVEVIFHPVS